MKIFSIILFGLIEFNGVLLAQALESASSFSSSALSQTSGLLVRVRNSKGDETEMVLLGKTDKNLRMQVKGSTAETAIALNQIVGLEFIMPANWEQAQQELDAGQFEKAAAMMGAGIMPLLDYLDLPNSNAPSLVMKHADLLRYANKLDEAAVLYNKLRMLPEFPQAAQSMMWAAYCLAAQGKTDEATKILATITPFNRDHELFGVERLIHARLHLAKKDYRSTLDEVAQVIAFSRMESDSFPESLFISAECYEALGGNAQATPESKNQTAAANATDYNKVAQSIYQEIVKNFTNTPWAKKSQLKVSAISPTTLPAKPSPASTPEAKPKGSKP